MAQRLSLKYGKDFEKINNDIG
jgi:predicted acylesterase/phospholipase RssA